VDDTTPAGAAVCGIEAEVARVARRLLESGVLSMESEPRMLGLAGRFAAFASRAFGVVSLADVSSQHVDAFVRSSNAGSGVPPSVATMRLRRSMLRSLFRVARELDLIDGDPTIDLTLPSRTNHAARPLIDAEVELCRRAALSDLASTRLSSAWALGEATARTAEIPHLRRSDLDLAGVRVWIHGSSNTEPRWGALSDWGLTQLERQATVHESNAENWLLAYPGSGNRESRRSHSAQAIRETMERAGLTGDPRVRPASLAGWAGSVVLRGTGRIEDVARALGVRSLDGAARAIDWDWTVADE
jgi:integrase/recombinase XerC